ncbi:DUF1444 domain-containing protein [Nocardia heshunensis]
MGLLGGVFGLSREKFAKQALAAVRGSRDIVDAEIVADHFGIVFDHAGGESALIELEPYYARAAAVDRGGRERVLRSLTAALRPLVSRPRTWSEAAPALRTVVRRIGYGCLPGIDPGQWPVSRPLVPNLVEMLVLDRPTTMSYVSADVLAGWSISATEAFAVARQNLAGQGREFLVGFTPETPVLEQIFDAADGLNYVGSMPLIPGWMTALGDRLPGRPIVFLLQQAGLVIADNTAPQGLPYLLDISEDVYSRADRPISPLPYTIDERGELIPYDVPADAPGWDELRYAERLLAFAVCEDQADLIRAAQTSASDLAEYPAPLLHAELPDGSMCTTTAWTDGVETLLPKADLVSLQTRDLSTIPWYTADVEDSITVPWDVLDEAIGLTPADGFDPPRYRVGPGHPTAETLTRLRAEDLEDERPGRPSGVGGVEGVAVGEGGAVVVVEVEDQVVGDLE